MNENILTFNFANTLTVVLMVAIGFALLGLGQKLWQQKQSAGA